MTNAITGTAISVPADLVDMYVKAGFRLIGTPAQAEKPITRKRKPAAK